MSEAHKKKHSGSPKKPVVGPDGTIYESVEDAHRKTGIDRSVLFKRLKGKTPSRGFKYLNPTGASENGTEVSSLRVQGPDNKIYSSRSQASKNYKVSPTTIGNWIKNRPEKGFKYI